MLPALRRPSAWLRALADKAGATAIEYGLIAGLIALAIVASMSLMSGSLSSKFTKVSSALTSSS